MMHCPTVGKGNYNSRKLAVYIKLILWKWKDAMAFTENTNNLTYFSGIHAYPIT